MLNGILANNKQKGILSKKGGSILDRLKHWKRIEKIEARSPQEISEEKFLKAATIDASLVRPFW